MIVGFCKRAPLFQRTFSSSSFSRGRTFEVDPNRVRVEKEDQVAKVILSRPDKMNALDIKMFESIVGAANQLRNDKSIRAVVLHGEGKAFCSGIDLSAVKDPRNMDLLLKKPSATPISNLAQDVAYVWRGFPLPVISSLHGVCFGGGLQIALGSDIRICAPDCKFSVMEGKWGLIPDMTLSVTLRELVRIDVAKELTFSARIFDGVEAAKLGLVTRVEEDPLDAAMKLAKDMVKRSPDALAYAKRMFQKTWVDASEEEALREETELQKEILLGWNQIAKAVGTAVGVSVPFKSRSVDANTDPYFSQFRTE